MNRAEALHAMTTLAASPAAKWVGNKLVDGKLLVKCTRCGAEDTLLMPASPSVVPPGFDKKLFVWKRSFQIAHEACLENKA
jgi:hypothetical protein